MISTKLFKKWSFDCESVTLIRRGDELVIRPKKDDWSELEDLASEFDPDFMAGADEDLIADKPVHFE